METKQPHVDPYNAGYDQPTDNFGVSPAQVHIQQPQPGGAPPAYPASGPQVHVQQPGYPGAVPGANNTTVVMMQSMPSERISLTGHIIFSCFVFWCCGWMFGLIAFILAMVAQDRSNAGDVEGARSMGKASLIVSVVGVIVGVVALIVIIVYFVQATKEVENIENSWNDNLKENLNNWNNEDFSNN